MSTLSRREREREQRREAILDAAEGVFFSQGLDAPMEEIAAQAGIAKGTLYLSFSSKDDILLMLVSRALARLTAMFEEAARIDGGVRARILAFGEAYQRFAMTQPDYFRLLTDLSSGAPRAQASDEVRAIVREGSDRAWRAITGMLQESIDAGRLRDDLTAFEMATILWSASTGVLRQIDAMRAIERPGDEGSPFSMQSVDTARIYSATIALLANSLAK